VRRAGRPQPGGDPADVGRQHPDLEEGHVRARHAQPHRHHLRLALPHRTEDTGGGTEAHAPQRHLRPHAVGCSHSRSPPVARCLGCSGKSLQGNLNFRLTGGNTKIR
jgi:hypothetical protein